MPKALVKITVLMEDRPDTESSSVITNYITCKISSRDESWHGLKELEHEGLFKKLSELANKPGFKFVHGDSILSRTLRSGKPLSPNLELYSFERKLSPKEIKDQLKTIDFKFDGKITVQQLKNFFDELGFTAVVTDKYNTAGITPTTSLEDYAYSVSDKWYETIEADSDSKTKVHNLAKIGEFPDIQTYIDAYPDLYREGRDFGKDTKQQIVKSNLDAQGFEVIFRGKDAVEQAILDAIDRMETLDANGNLGTCPITLESFEAHHKVILILSRSEDGTLKASFVKRESREGKKVTDILEYLKKKLKKNPDTNDPIVALEVGTLSDLKDKYRKTVPKMKPL